jgi:hypothetical protein
MHVTAFVAFTSYNERIRWLILSCQMSNLYKDLSEIYEGMYQTSINYEDEFKFYSKILSDHHCRNIVEMVVAPEAWCHSLHGIGLTTQASI